MKIGLYLYFRPSLGGGERYLLTAAEALRSLGQVDFLCPAAVDLRPFEEYFGLDLRGVRPIHYPWRHFHGYRDWLRPSRYDLFIALDNHLAPRQPSLGRRGVLHLQTPPYPPPVHHPLRARLGLRTYDLVVCNSEYTRQWVLRHGTAGLPTRVLYPPIDVDLYTPLEKKRIILSVGRFFVGRHEKMHGLMIDCFRKLLSAGLEGWELHLAGSLREYEPDHVAYLEELRRRADGLPIRFHVEAPLREMRQLYGEASLYWHATGYGVDDEIHPQHLEHFGMAVVEAMAAGAIPIVIRKGGLLEIVTEGETGRFWDEPADLERCVQQLAQAPPALVTRMREKAIQAAKRFSKQRFAAEIRALAAELTGV